MLHRLRLTFSDGRATPIHSAELKAGQLLVIGRGVLHDNFKLGKGVSKTHAEVRLSDTGVAEIRKLRSDNDVFVDDVELEEHHGFVRLDVQNVVQTGNSLWVYEVMPASLGVGKDNTRASAAMRRID